MNRVSVVDIANLDFAYSGLTVLESVNVTIFEREFIAIVGPNAGGKTTLIKLMLGLLAPDTGVVRLFGQKPRLARTRVGYMPQQVSFDPKFPVSVMDIVLMGRLANAPLFGPYRQADRRAALDALDEVGMIDSRRRLFAQLSGGQRQRTLIARALAGNPDMLMLDEPTANLDLVAERELYELLRQLTSRMTVLIVSHDLGFVSEFVNRVLCVRKHVFTHGTDEISDEVIKEVFGAHRRVVRHHHKNVE